MFYGTTKRLITKLINSVALWMTLVEAFTIYGEIMGRSFPNKQIIKRLISWHIHRIRIDGLRTRVRNNFRLPFRYSVNTVQYKQTHPTDIQALIGVFFTERKGNVFPYKI